MVSYFLLTKAMLNDFRELDELVFFDLWIPDSGFRIPDSSFWFSIPIPDSGFRFPGFRVTLLLIDIIVNFELVNSVNLIRTSYSETRRDYLIIKLVIVYR